MDETLADGRNWLVANRMSLADINLMPFVARLEYLNLLDLFIAGRPRVQAWWERSKGLQSYRKAVPEMLTQDDVSTMQSSGTAIRDRIHDLRSQHVVQYRLAQRTA